MKDISVIGCGRWGTFLAWYAANRCKDKINNVLRYDLKTSPNFIELRDTRKNEYLSLEKSFNSKIEFSRVVLCQNEIAIIKEKLFGAEFSGIVTKFKWNIWGNNNVNGLSTPNGDHLDDKNKSKNYYENDSSTNQMSTQRRLGLIKTKKTENPIINNYLSRSISLFS